MGKFGWSYPPGCKGSPYDDEYPCNLCGEEAGWCSCPVCGVCDTQGNPECYDDEGHGIQETKSQRRYAREVQEKATDKAGDETQLYQEEIEYFNSHIA